MNCTIENPDSFYKNSQKVFKDDDAILNCLYEANDSITWYRRGFKRPFPQRNIAEKSKKNNTFKQKRIFSQNNSLLIKKARFADIAIYECFINMTKIGQVNLTVIRKIPGMNFFPSESYTKPTKYLLWFMSTISIAIIFVYIYFNFVMDIKRQAKCLAIQSNQEQKLNIKDLILENTVEYDKKLTKTRADEVFSQIKL